MSGVNKYYIELETNVRQTLADVKSLQDRMDKLEGKEHKLDISIDTEKLEKVISNLDKMLNSLGKGTGDFKQFEKLSKQLQEAKGNIDGLKKSLGTLNADKGMKNILTAINSIDSSLTTLTTNLKGITSINTGGAEKEMKDLASAGDKVADSMERAAQAKKKLAETDLSSGGNSGKKNRYANAKKMSEEDYNQNYQKYIDTANKQIKSKGSTILGNSVDVKFVDGLAQVNAKIKEADGSWKSFSARIDADGKIFNQQVKAVKKDINQLEAEFQNFGKDTPKIFDTSKQKEWLESFNVLKELQKKSSELNNLNANNVNGKNDFAIQELRKEIESLEPSAEKARQTIQNLGTSAESLDKIGISAKQGAEAIDLIDNAAKGSSKSIVSAVTTYEKFLNSANTDLAKFQKQKPMSETFSENVTKLKTEITNYSNLLTQVKANGGIASKEENENLNKYRDTISKLTTDIKEMSAAEKGAKEPGLSKVFKEITELKDKYSGMSKEFKRELAAMEFQFRKAGDSLNLADARKQLVDFEAQLIRTGNNTKSMFSAIKDKMFYGLAGQIANMVSLYDVINLGKQAVNQVIELDTALVDLQKTTTMSSSQLNQFYYDANDVAKQMGVTTQEIIEQASAWSRLGYSSAEAATQMAQLSSQFASISPGMETSDAQEGLVSIMKAWNIGVDDVKSEIMDKINILGNTMAESNQDIVEGMERSAAALASVGTSTEDAFAMFSAIQEVLQSSEVSGRALRSISMRIRGYDEETESLSDDLKNVTGELVDLTKTAEHSQGVSIFKDGSTTEFKSLVDYFGEISDIWDEMTQKQQSDFLQTAFGKTQADLCLYVQKCA